jgi:hypothetical protein
LVLYINNMPTHGTTSVKPTGRVFVARYELSLYIQLRFSFISNILPEFHIIFTLLLPARQRGEAWESFKSNAISKNWKALDT